MTVSTTITEIETTVKAWVKNALHVVFVPVIAVLKGFDAFVQHLVAELSKL